MITSDEIRTRFLKFFEKRGHVIIPSASLVPENDPSVLFNTAGMQPLIPYLLGQEHPKGNRLVNSQKCVRTQDIDEVGDNTHDTFFEMLGNWSLGDYFKKEAIEWSYEFLTSEEEGLGLNPKRLYVTCFEGDDNSPRDEESAAIWKEIFDKNNIRGERIYFRGVDKNWWSVGDNGPCGPDTEMFYDLTGKFEDGMTLEEYMKADEDQKVVEVWNDVFMEYLKKDGKIVSKLQKKNVDTGSGLERVVMAVQNKNNIFDTDLFSPLMTELDKAAPSADLKTKRIIADHIRTSVFLISDGVVPSNKDRGYVLRRLLRRVLAIENRLALSPQIFENLIIAIIKIYTNSYPSLVENRDKIINTYFAESEKFKSTLGQGLRELNKYEEVDAEKAFHLYESFGLPYEVIKDTSPEKSKNLSREDFDKKFKEHQELSRSGAEKKFKSVLK